MITSEDDYFHSPRSEDPFWNESAWFLLDVPEHGIGGFIKLDQRPNVGLMMGGLGLWDGTGDQVYDCLHYDWGTWYEIAPGSNMFDFSIPGGLAMRCVEPLQAYHFTYKTASCELELTWEGFTGVHEVGLPPGLEEWGTSRYEQAGRIHGSLMVEGRRIEFDGFSARDHCWGVRRPQETPRGTALVAIANEQSGFLAYPISQVPAEVDPVIGTREPLAKGWLLREGVVSDLVSGVQEVTERDAGGRPVRVVFDATDDLGRDLHAEARCVSWLTWPDAYGNFFQWWCLAEWTLDGERVWGEVQDYWYLPHTRRFLRRLKDR